MPFHTAKDCFLLNLNIEFPFNSLNSEIQIGMGISFNTDFSYNFNSNLYFLDISKQKLTYLLPSVISRSGLALKMCKCQNEISCLSACILMMISWALNHNKHKRRQAEMKLLGIMETN